MKKMFKKVISLFLASIMMFTIFSVSAIENVETTINVGQIVSEEGIDVSNIKLDILSSELVMSEDGINQYSNTYCSSVYTDEQGNYTFNKPSENYLINVCLDTLPLKTGVDTTSLFVKNNNTIETINLSEINDVIIESADLVILKDKNGNEIFADLNIETNTPSINEPMALKISDSIETTVNVQVNGIEKTAIIHEKLSDSNPYEQIDFLYKNGVITEKQQIEMYLETLKLNQVNIESLTPIYATLENYSFANMNSDLSKEITSYFESLNAQNEFVTTRAANGTASCTVNGKTINYKLYFETTSAQTDSAVLTSYVQDIIDYYYKTVGYKFPAYESGKTSYEIYFNDKISANGNTTPSGSSSYITIKYPPNSNNNTTDDKKRTIAHEIFHSIQREYNNGSWFSDAWFTEASATWAGSDYLKKYNAYTVDHANNYLTAIAPRLTDMTITDGYKAFLFPQFLSQKFPSGTFMKNIMTKIGNGQTVYSAIGSLNSNYSYGDLFAEWQAYNADPRRYNYSNNAYNEAKRVQDNVDTFTSQNVFPTSAKHYGYKASSSTSSKLTLTVNVNAGSYTNGIFYIVKYPGNGSINTIPTKIVPVASSTIIEVTNFKTGTTSTNYSRVTLVMSNISTSSTNTGYYNFGVTRAVS